jgi:transcriptional regulator with XRE-family HTH domain
MAAAMEADRQAEMAERIRSLRGPVPQPVIADRIGIGLRAYQEWEGGRAAPSWENLKRLAEVHGISEDLILYGPDGARPQLVEAEPERAGDLHAEVVALRADVARISADVARLVAAVELLVNPLQGLLQAQGEAIQRAAAPAPRRAAAKRRTGASRPAG